MLNFNALTITFSCKILHTDLSYLSSKFLEKGLRYCNIRLRFRFFMSLQSLQKDFQCHRGNHKRTAVLKPWLWYWVVSINAINVKVWKISKQRNVTISRTSFRVYALSDIRIRSPTTGTETSSYLHAKSIATRPTNWSFFLTTDCFSKNLSIRLTVRNNVSCRRSNLSCTWKGFMQNK